MRNISITRQTKIFLVVIEGYTMGYLVKIEQLHKQIFLSDKL